METNERVGFVAAFCTTTSILPQAIKTIGSGKTDDISLIFFALLVLGLFLWLIHGIMIKNRPIIFGNIFSLIFAIPVLFLKISHGGISSF